MKALFVCAVFFLFAGSRFSDGELAGGLFRSLHAVDILCPLLLISCISNIRYAKCASPAYLYVLWVLWIFYSVTLGQTGHFLTGLAVSGEYLLVSVLFALKEVEFFVLMTFSAIVAFRYPLFVKKVVWLMFGGLCLWLPVDLLSPSGYYLLGLPFEKGAIQTGLVYSFAAIFAVVLLLTFHPETLLRKLLGWSVVGILTLGMFLSLSRTAVLGFVAAILVLLALIRLRRAVMVSIAAITVLCVAAISMPDKANSVIDLMFGRWGDVTAHSGYRLAKWLELWAFLCEHPELLLFGAGFGSPNPLVFGYELGHILAVDNAYVRRIFEVGLVGALIYALLLIGISAALFNERLCRCGLAVMCAFAFSGITAETNQITQSGGIAFFLIGILFGLCRAQITFRERAKTAGGQSQRRSEDAEMSARAATR